MGESVTVRSGGDILDGWKSASVSSSVDELVGTFDLTFPEIRPSDPVSRELKLGSSVEIYFGSELAISGRVTTRRKRYSGRRNSIQVGGQDHAVDLLECSALNEPGEWSGARVATIAEELISPFPRLRFREELSPRALGSVEKFSFQTGETVFESLSRIARMLGMVVRSDLNGGVFFGRPGTARAPVSLEQGVNIDAGDLVEDGSERFSRYVVHGQGPGNRDWGAGGRPGKHFRAEAIDAAVSAYRPLVLVAEAGAREQELQTRAGFEASGRAARSRSLSYRIPGWRLGDYFWRPGDLVPVFDPDLETGTEGGAPVDMLIGSVVRTSSEDDGEESVVSLWLPGAFTPDPPSAIANEGLEAWA